VGIGAVAGVSVQAKHSGAPVRVDGGKQSTVKYPVLLARSVERKKERGGWGSARHMEVDVGRSANYNGLNERPAAARPEREWWQTHTTGSCAKERGQLCTPQHTCVRAAQFAAHL
jgi:hypothetical protein